MCGVLLKRRGVTRGGRSVVSHPGCQIALVVSRAGGRRACGQQRGRRGEQPEVGEGAIESTPGMTGAWWSIRFEEVDNRRRLVEDVVLAVRRQDEGEGSWVTKKQCC